MKITNCFLRILLPLGLILLLCLSSCNGNKFNKKPNVSGIEVTVEVQRFEHDLLQVDTTNVEAGLALLQQKYPQFLDVWGNRIMGMGSLQAHRADALQNYNLFLRDRLARNLLDTAYRVFTPFDNIQGQLHDAFVYRKYYFPSRPVPKVITCVSFFERAAVTYDTTILALCLDMHLGKGFGYPQDVPVYVQQTLTPDYLVPHAIKVLYGMDFETAPQNSTLLAEMIHNGIQLYYLDLLLPDTKDYLKIDYTMEQQQWCEDNEPEMWNFFLGKKLLYGIEMTENRKYIYPGPFTSGMPPQSPGNAGSWIGWQIVRKFMQENPDTKFEDLVRLDPQEILTRSKYKPKHTWL